MLVRTLSGSDGLMRYLWSMRHPQRSAARTVPSRDPEALAAGLISMCETDRRETEQHARTRIVENFSAEKMVKLTEGSIACLTL
jgi:hypothetical protein